MEVLSSSWQTWSREKGQILPQMLSGKPGAEPVQTWGLGEVSGRSGIENSKRIRLKGKGKELLETVVKKSRHCFDELCYIWSNTGPVLIYLTPHYKWLCRKRKRHRQTGRETERQSNMDIVWPAAIMLLEIHALAGHFIVLLEINTSKCVHYVSQPS